MESVSEHYTDITTIVAAYDARLSIRQIATATGLSPSRVHQLLTADEAREIPVWLSRLRAQGLPSNSHAGPDQPTLQHLIQARLIDEVEVLRWCLDWLAQLERGDEVIVNLRPDTDAETEFVRFDRPHVLGILARIAADLDELAHDRLEAREEETDREEDPRMRRRRRLAEPDSQPKPLSRRERRAALRNAFGLPPFERR